MKMVKYGHACVRLEKDGRALAIDPGELTPEPAATEGVEAVLITHQHADHYSVERLWEVPAIYTCPGVARVLDEVDGFRELARDRVHVVRHGDTFEAAGFEVRVVGEKHHLSHLDLPPVDNTGFLLDGEVFHPGDALTRVDVPTLLLPGQAPWLTVPMMTAYLRAVAPQRAFAIHDGLVNEIGLEVLDDVLAMEARRAGREIRRPAVGETVEL
ncbi:MBL fold metallo-hydrolase [Actinomadura logoneensis]|uniref:MBL fold metallo-hydrolase n=1 Tax=Actinomadura logoneensis TaxID=2293572 RepID=A0A372JHW8_9ACTN|nr:MBL fold metallo-hydrolase [Actinomadura logoneensis]RFU39499.1 MBL fold metallo-hydrolase [Actinomadura logoneensis]